ncbi:MAG: hypothetical protein WC082_13275 [Victivallales bacterium]
MKKLLVLIAVLFAVVAVFGEETENADWEVAPGIISGGYSEQTGPYIYKFVQKYDCPSMDFDSKLSQNWYYKFYYQKIYNLGFGDFALHGGGTLISSDTEGEIQKVSDGTIAVSFTSLTTSGEVGSNDPPASITEDEALTGNFSTAYVYKKEFIQKMEVEFSAETYTAATGENLTVTVMVYAGSGYYSLSSGTRPAFLTMVSSRTWEGKCYEAMEGSIAIVVKDIVTGQECSASATIVITENSGSSDSSGSSGSSGTTSDPGDTATDPASDGSDGGDDGGDDGTSVGDGDTGDTGGDDGGDDSGGAVDPGSSDDDPEADSDDSESEDESEDDETEDEESDDSGAGSSTATDPSSSDSTDSPTDTSTADNSDSTTDSADQTDSSGDDDAVIVVSDGTDPADTSGSSDIADGSDTSSDTSDTVIISDTTEEDDSTTTVIVVNDSSASDTDTIVVTDDGVTTVDSDNYDLAVFMGMFGAMTALNGSATTSESAPMAVQEARGGKDHE